MVARAFAAEFPNDNPALHQGAIWIHEVHRDSAVCVLPERRIEVRIVGDVPVESTTAWNVVIPCE